MGRQFLIQEAPVVVPDVPDLTIVLEEIREKPDDLFLHESLHGFKFRVTSSILFITQIQVIHLKPCGGEFIGKTPNFRLSNIRSTCCLSVVSIESVPCSARVSKVVSGVDDQK